MIRGTPSLLFINPKGGPWVGGLLFEGGWLLAQLAQLSSSEDTIIGGGPGKEVNSSRGGD